MILNPINLLCLKLNLDVESKPFLLIGKRLSIKTSTKKIKYSQLCISQPMAVITETIFIPFTVS